MSPSTQRTLAAVALLSMASSATAATIPMPAAGTYICRFQTLTYVPNGAGGMMMMPTVNPSALGRLTLDGKGNYRQLINGGKAGRYSVDAASGAFKFLSGPLSKMAAVYEFRDDGFKARTFTVEFKKDSGDKGFGSHFCVLSAGSSGQPLTNVKPAPTVATTTGAQPSASNPNPGFKGTLLYYETANIGAIQTLDLASGKKQTRLSGRDPYTAANGETVYVNKQGEIVIAGKEYSRLVTLPAQKDEGDVSLPVLSPDGKKVAYYAETSYYQRRVVVRARSGALLAIFDAMTSPAWAPGDRLLVAASTSTEGAKPGFFLSTPDLASLTPIPIGIEDLSAPAISPDGKQIAFVSNHDIWTVNVDGTGLKGRTSNDVAEAFPAWGPDSRSLAFIRDDNTGVLLILGPNDKAPRDVLDAGGKVIQIQGRPVWR